MKIKTTELSSAVLEIFTSKYGKTVAEDYLSRDYNFQSINSDEIFFYLETRTYKLSITHKKILQVCD